MSYKNRSPDSFWYSVVLLLIGRLRFVGLLCARIGLLVLGGVGRCVLLILCGWVGVAGG